MIKIKKIIADQIVAHAQRDLPNEACGYLAGKDGVITNAYELTNLDASPEHFSFDPKEQFNVVKQTRNADLDIIGNYHSHPSTPARPSIEDIRLAYDASILYFIISMATATPDIKAFRIVGDLVTNIPIEIV